MKTSQRVFSCALGAALLLGACSENGADDVGKAEQAAASPSVSSGAVTATLETTSSWSGGFCQSVTIKNTGAAVSDWTLTIATNGATVSNLWSATQTTSGGTMTVKPLNYNANIPSQGSVSFGFCGTGNVLPTPGTLTVVGGNGGTGGASSTGGSSAKGGTTSIGGSSAKGGTTSTGGTTSKGGTTSVGGTSSKGGTSSTGGTTGGIISSCTEAQKTVTSNTTGTHCGYTYEYWKDSGSGSLVLKADGYSVDWSNINNLLGRKGIRPGSSSASVTYEANYQPNGNSYLCVYG
ncbi:MAG: cellulose binding domain-containing protein [Polyangiaceae bacterium]